MPNVSFDIFFDQDFINVTASRGKVAPKAKPEWKIRTAPKLPPKEESADPLSTPHPPKREKLTASRQSLPAQLKQQQGENGSENSVNGEKRKPPKLGPSKASLAAQK